MRFPPSLVRGYLACRVFDRTWQGEHRAGGCAAFEFSGICPGWLFLALLHCASRQSQAADSRRQAGGRWQVTGDKNTFRNTPTMALG